MSVRSGTGEDAVRSDPAPDNVRFAFHDRISVLPGGPAVRSPRHLEDVDGGAYPLHPQTGPEGPTAAKVLDEFPDGRQKPGLLVRAELVPVGIEPLLAEMLTYIRRFDDDDFVEYGVTAEQVSALRARVDSWRNELLRNPAP